MRILIASALIAGATVVAVPASAQGIYIGPNGVGVDSGYGRGYGHRDYDRDDYREGYHRRGYYEGRSVAPGYGHRDYFYDHY